MSAEVLPGHTFSSRVDHGMLPNAGAGSTPQMRHISSPPSPHTMATSASSRPPFRRGSVIVNFVILQSPDCIPQLSPAFRDIPRHSVVTRLAFRCIPRLLRAAIHCFIGIEYFRCAFIIIKNHFCTKNDFILRVLPRAGQGVLVGAWVGNFCQLAVHS